MALADLPGLAGAKRLVQRLSRSADVTAVLLYGTAGAHQLDVAHTLAAAWICTAPTEEGPCGTCPGCGAVSRDVHVDLLWVRPSGAGNQIRIHQITEVVNPPEVVTPIQRFVGTPPLMAPHKVVILVDVHRLNDRAANALLKTLEEPHPYVRFILTTSEIGEVMPTIRSRCLGVACELPGDEEARTAYGEAAPLYQLAPHAAARLRLQGEAFAKLNQLVDGLASEPVGAALRMAEDLRAISGELDSESAEREGLVATLELFAMLVSRRYPERPDWSRRILNAHRQVLGNVSSRTALDALFCRMLIERG
jgi:DNA polymerase-3 subunit delta'